MAKKKEEIGELAIALSFESKDANKQISALNKSINRTEKEFKSASKGVKDFENTYQGLNAKIKKTSNQLDDYNKKLEVQEKQEKTLSSALDKSKNKLDELEKSVGKNSKEWKQQAELVQKNADKLSKLSSDISITKNNISKLTKELNDSRSKFEELGNKSKTLEEKLSDISKDAELTKSEFNKLSAELNKNGSTFKKLGNEINKLSSEIKSGESKIQAYETEINKLSDTLDKQKNEYSSLESKIKVYSKEIERLSSVYGENSSITEQYRQELYKLKDTYNSLETEINQNESELKQYKTEVNNTKVKLKELSDELLKMPFEKIGENIKRSGDNLKTVGTFMSTSVTLPILASGAAATKAGTDFTTAMSKLQATSGIAEKTSDSYKKLEKKALEMGSSTSFSASEAADGLTYLALAGWDVETQVKRIEPILRAAEAGGIDLARTADLVTDSMSSASVESKDFSKYLDIVAQSQRKSNTSMEQMLEAYIVAGGLFNSLNIPLEKSGALLGVLANRGTKGSEAGNALISVFSNLITETGQAGKALDKMGISLYTSTGKQKDMVTVLKEMAKKLGVAKDGTSKLTEQQKQQYAAMVGGKTQFDTLMKLLAGVSGEYDDLYNQLVNSNGALSEMSSTMKDNLGGSIESMKSAIEGALIKAFNSMEPAIEGVVEKITDLANWFSGLDEEQQKNIVTMVGVAATLGPLLSLFGQFLVVGGNAVTLFGALKTGTLGATASTGLLSSAISILTGPAGFVLLVSSIIAVASALGDNEKKLTELQEKWGLFGQVIGSICETMTGTVELSIGNISIMISTLGKIIGAVFRGDFKSIDDIWTEGWAKIENNTAKAMSDLRMESSSGIALMRQMTEVELNNTVGTLDVALKRLPKLTADNVDEMAKVFVTRLQGLDEDTLTILKGTSDTMAILFEGIYTNMNDEEATNKFKANLESMAKSGEFTSDKISKDIANAMDLIDRNVMDGSERVKISAQDMFDGISNISQFGMDSAVDNIVYSINNMSDETIKSLSDMGGHWYSIFGGIALTGKEAVGDMESHIRGRLEELSKTSPNFISEMKDQMDTYFEEINNSGTTNTSELSSNVEEELKKVAESMDNHTKEGANSVDINTKKAVKNADTNTKDLSKKVDDNTKKATKNADINTKDLSSKVDANTKDAKVKAKTNMDDAAKGISKAMSNMTKEAKKGTGDVAKNTDLDMKQASKSMKQSATDMYKGVTTSVKKMSDKSKQSATDMYKGVTTSAEKMSKNAKQSATNMYKGVTTSTKKMADKAIADWNRIRNAYSQSIQGTVTKKTVNKIVSQENGGRSIKPQKIKLLDSKMIKSYGLRGPRAIGYAISSNYYKFDNTKTLSKSIDNNTFNTVNNELTNELLTNILQVLENNNKINNQEKTTNVNLIVDGKEFTNVILPYLPEKLKQNDILNNRRRGEL